MDVVRRWSQLVEGDRAEIPFPRLPALNRVGAQKGDPLFLEVAEQVSLYWLVLNELPSWLGAPA